MTKKIILITFLFLEILLLVFTFVNFKTVVDYHPPLSESSIYFYNISIVSNSPLMCALITISSVSGIIVNTLTLGDIISTEKRYPFYLAIIFLSLSFIFFIIGGINSFVVQTR